MLQKYYLKCKDEEPVSGTPDRAQASGPAGGKSL